MEDQTPYAQLTTEFVKEFLAAQDGIGCNALHLAKGVFDLTKATKVEVFKSTVTEYQDGRPVRSKDEVIYSRRLKDNVVRQKGITLALILRGVPTTSPTSSITIDKPGSVNVMGAVAKFLGQAEGNGDS